MYEINNLINKYSWAGGRVLNIQALITADAYCFVLVKIILRQTEHFDAVDCSKLVIRPVSI